MFKALLGKMISRFESNYDYDASYMHEVNTVSSGATVRLMMLSGMTNYQGTDKSIWGGAALGATLHGDCGPCVKLMVDRLLEQGLGAQELVACLHNDWSNASSIGLGFRFSQAVLNNDQSLENLRIEILDKYGEAALLAASFATVSYPIYPLLKRALGAAKSCQSIDVGEHKNIRVDEYR